MQGYTWSHHEIRRLLMNLSRPRALERDPIALSLQRALGSSSPRRAVADLVERTFVERDPATQIERTVIEQCDLQGRGTREVARELHLSLRQFFRYRARAMAAIAATLANLLADAGVRPAERLLDAYLQAYPPSEAGGQAAAAANEREAYVTLRARLGAWLPFHEAEAERFGAFHAACTWVHMARRYDLEGESADAGRLLERAGAALGGLPSAEAAHVAFLLADTRYLIAGDRGERHAMEVQLEAMAAFAPRTPGPELSEAIVLLRRGGVQAAGGAFGDARRSMRDALRIRQTHGELTLVAGCVLLDAAILFYEGRTERAWELARTARAVQPHGPELFPSACALESAAALALERSWEAPAAAPAPFLRTRHYGLLQAIDVHRHASAGNLAPARAALASAETIVTASAGPLLNAYVTHARAFLAQASGQQREAEALFQRAETAFAAHADARWAPLLRARAVLAR
ncbi:hypothetical protein EPN52_11700 [bacterium]|nr:MAG: hypothetical protein EPN52_11700 [bacterium]